MRLFDKVAMTEPSIAALAHKTIVVACDMVASDCYSDPIKAIVEKCPLARSPWDQAFLEWNVPIGAECGSGHFQQIGFSLMSHTERSHKMELTAMLVKNHWWTDEIGQLMDSYGDDVELAVPFVCYRGQAVKLPFGELLFFDSEGAFAAKRSLLGDVNGRYPFPLRTWGVVHDANIMVVIHALMLCNCHNVSLVDVTEELQPEPKIRRRLKLPEVKRYTLNIAGHIARPSRDYNEGPQGVMPFHLCRGHFATYTADKPMFGNPKLVGRYWHPPHMKGKKENGEIVKDYAIAQ